MANEGAVAEWGEDLASVDGYVAKGAFARDVAAFFGDGGRSKDFDADAARAEKMFARLPEKHRASAMAFDRLVKGGEYPAIVASSINGYGFDCVKNDLYGMAEEQFFGLGYNGFGDLYLLNVDTGAVHTWLSDSDPTDDVFPSLDAWAYAMLRHELARKKRIDGSALGPVFERLGFGWAAPQG